MIKKFCSFCLLLIWVGLIFGFSQENGSESSGMSEKLIKGVVMIFTDIDSDNEKLGEIVNKYSFPVRKAAHFTEYFILSIITLNFFACFEINYRILIYSALFCILVAVCDEFFQTFIPGRDGNIKDVLLDSSGALIGSYLVSRFYLFRGKNEINS